MTKSDLYKEIIQQLADRLVSIGVISVAEKSNVQGNIDLTKYDEACDKLLSCAGIGVFRKIVKYLKDGLTDNDILFVTLPLRHRIVGIDNQKRLADFTRRSTDLTVITAKAIRGLVTHPDETAYDSNRFSVLEMIWLLVKDNQIEMTHLWEMCQGQHQDEYYLFTSQPDDADGDWRLYAYAYFCYVNEGHFERPAVLNFTASTQFEPSGITFQATNKYEQYFDAYNVMSESKFADDVLIRYLRMFQILEYFGYRRALANMTKGNIKENGFVRNVISIANGSSKNESVEIKNGINGLLPPLSAGGGTHPVFDSADFTPQRISFIRDKLLIDNFNYNDGRIWDVIYKLRNCIVHNKEADLHFTYANTEAYNDGIDLMKLFIRKLEPEIVKIINDPSITGLEFNRQYEPMY